MNDFEVEVKFVPVFRDEEHKDKFLETLRSIMKPRAQWYTFDKNPMRVSYRNGRYKFTAKFNSGEKYSRIEIEKEIDQETARVLVQQHCTTWILKDHAEWKLPKGEILEINHFLRAKNVKDLPIVLEVEYHSKRFDVEDTKARILQDFSEWISDVIVIDHDDHKLDNFNLSIEGGKFISDDIEAMEAAMEALHDDHQ